MKTWKVSPYYWEKCAGDEPFVYQYAESEFEAIQLTYPLPWNTTFGARAMEVKDSTEWNEVL